MGKNQQNLQSTNLGEKNKNKNWYRGIYMCVQHERVWNRNYV